MSKRTDSSAMESLFDAFADTLKDMIVNGRAAVDKDTGEVVRITPEAASLNVIRQFLKDNGQTVLPGTNKAVNDIASQLPFGGEEYEEGYAH
ncbi:hypothetical protein GOB43_17905 [Sinorhizobium meliloti]|uniref:hypothetical protein n=1 Tax=Rhizobium meliloti TaxID=382 RepID=UPI000FD7526A|nr:hypothetical protein [Sinorhizobium meliloti]MDW9519139.1 hypothetical protein [Sinorhizobium meliloti]MDX0094238.1 hypothetical protein [Sinorhizobium meliloti]MDX0139256.1 hypothetical protein [Sinorhizobium meliloti]MDX0194066.1 hypothetical protein [Sinorhizobium meliloti]MDX0382595.1 hypothetical protein [Sinorhizobium meliloti]